MYNAGMPKFKDTDFLAIPLQVYTLVGGPGTVVVCNVLSISLLCF